MQLHGCSCHLQTHVDRLSGAFQFCAFRGPSGVERRKYPASVIDAAKYIGKQFGYGGRGPDVFDCFGLVKAIYFDLGIDLPDYVSVDDKSLIHGLINEGKERFIEVAQPEPGAIVTMSVHPRYVSHIGVVLDDSYRFIHISEKICVTVERLSSPLFIKRIRGFYLWKK